jgi:hypothetical protein
VAVVDTSLVRVDMALSAMALDVDHGDDHPNALPFSGVLTRLDQPSDKAPHGSKGRRVIMRASAAEAGLKTLMGMGVNYMTCQSGHDVTKKVGVITGADIVGDAVQVSGILYAKDFPSEVAAIQASKDDLGFSWEVSAAFDDPAADPLDITRCIFTGAAILRKDKAAYTNTSLSAMAAASETEMTKEEMEALLAAALGPVTERMTAMETTLQASAVVRAKVEPFANDMDGIADRMEAEGVGTDERRGHVKGLRAMAASMRADAAQGRVPAQYDSYMYGAADPKTGAQPDAAMIASAVEAAVKPLREELASEKTKVADLQASATRNSPAPERKTVPAATLQAMAKAGLVQPGEGEKLSIADVDKALEGMPTTQRLQAKAGMRQAGLLN